MRQLLIKGAEFKWTKELQDELDYIKDALTKDPVLKSFNVDEPITIYTDASTKGLAYVQIGDDGKEHVIAYGGRALSKAQEGYTPAELEMMSVVLAM